MAEKSGARMSRADLVVIVGLACLTVGAWALMRWACLMIPGAILVWYSLPPRPPFVIKGR